MTRKMMGVIYRAFKEGRLTDVDKEDISTAYEYVDKLSNYDFFRKYSNDIATISLREAVQDIFNGDYDKASDKIKGFKTVDLY